MQKKQDLLERLDAIGTILKDSGTALALLGLGSVGLETERLDAYSDLDFFVIVKPGWKTSYLASLDWLSTLCSLAYVFRNTADGYKVLFEDGIFCEFAVLETHELSHLPFQGGRLIWKDGSFDEKVCTPPPKQQRAQFFEGTNEWHLGEALTNLYVGLGRVQRGEVLSGTRFIQSYAADHVLALATMLETAQGYAEDPFTYERRYEVRYPQTAHYLPAFLQGYEHNVESALALLTFLERHFKVNPAMSAALRERCTHP